MTGDERGAWKDNLEIVKRAVSRRDFIITSIAAGVMTMIPRFAGAQAGEPYRIGVLLPTTGSGANYSERPIKILPLIAAEINRKGGCWASTRLSFIFVTPRPNRMLGPGKPGHSF